MRLRISTQPTSISRSPRRASRPVVSVSRTISRSIAFPPNKTRTRWSSAGWASRPMLGIGLAATALQRFDDFIDLGCALGNRAARVHNEIGVRPLLTVMQLAGQDLLELLERHAGAGQNALALHAGRGADHHHHIDATVPAAFQEK